MIYIATCPQCGLIVRTENPNGEAACGCRVPLIIEPESPDGGIQEPQVAG